VGGAIMTVRELFTSARFRDGSEFVICPLHPGESEDSDASLVHIGGVTVIQDKKIAVISSKGVSEFEDKTRKSERGSEIKIRFFCESFFHEFYLIFNFLTGSTLCRVDVDKSQIGQYTDHGSDIWPSELWRS
jgi:hypothetical protein